MNKNSAIQHLSDERYLPWLGAFFGALLAAWVIFQGGGSINNDGLIYLEAARLLGDAEWKKGLEVYNWPLYPLLIAAVHQLTGLGWQLSAHGLAVLFFAISSAALLTLVKEVGGDRRVMLAAALLLFCSPYLVGTILPMVVRDPGFWAAHIWSIVFFIRYYRSGAWSHAWAWGAAAIVAMLFRIEAVTYLVLLPMLLLVRSDLAWKERIARLSKAQALVFVLMLGVLTILILNPELTLAKLGRLKDPLNVITGAYRQLTQGLAAKSQLYGEQILGPFLASYAMPGLALTLAYVLLVKAVSSAGWLQLALALYSRFGRNGTAMPKNGPVFGWLILLGLINAIAIILSVFLLPKRYVLPIGIVILVYAAFGLVKLFEAWRSRSWQWSATVAIGILVAVSVVFQAGSILWSWNPQKAYEQDAARWVMSHAPAGSRIYYDTPRLLYYATGKTVYKNPDRWKEIKQLVISSQKQQYDYLLVHVLKKRPDQEQFLNAQLATTPLAVFENGRNDRVLIYRTASER